VKKIVIAFEDIPHDLDIYDNVIYRLLSEKYEVEVVDTKNVKERDKIQYLFYSAYGSNYLNYSCIRIFITGENLCPDFNICDYAIGFEYMSFEDRYIRYPIYMWDGYQKRYESAKGRLRSMDTADLTKRKFCGMVVSNDLFADPYRIDFFKALSEYKQVDSGGKSHNNIGIPEGVEDKIDFLKDYKFSLAFENSSYSGYTTEKITDSFAARTVPIYWGDPRVKEQFNPNAFIDCTGKTLDEALEIIRRIDENDELYLKMLNEPSRIQSDVVQDAENRLKTFLYNIIDADYEKARRRPLIGKMAVYEEHYRKLVYTEMKIKKHVNLYKIVKFVKGKMGNKYEIG